MLFPGVFQDGWNRGDLSGDKGSGSVETHVEAGLQEFKEVPNSVSLGPGSTGRAALHGLAAKLAAGLIPTLLLLLLRNSWGTALPRFPTMLVKTLPLTGATASGWQGTDCPAAWAITTYWPYCTCLMARFVIPVGAGHQYHPSLGLRIEPTDILVL